MDIGPATRSGILQADAFVEAATGAARISSLARGRLRDQRVLVHDRAVFVGVEVE